MYKLTEDEIRKNNHYAKRKFTEMEEMLNGYRFDPKVIKRKESQECKSCFYLRGDRFSTQAFRDYDCRNCGKTSQWHNGDAPRFCSECSNIHNACVRCGANI